MGVKIMGAAVLAGCAGVVAGLLGYLWAADLATPGKVIITSVVVGMFGVVAGAAVQVARGENTDE